MPEYSDGIERPAWYDGTALTRGIEEYFSKPVDQEIARLKSENAEMHKALRQQAKAARAAAAA